MKMRSTVIAVTVAAIVLAGSFAVLMTDDSSADEPNFSDFYKNQLTEDGKKMYSTLLNDSLTIASDEVDGKKVYTVSVSVPVAVEGADTSALYEDFCSAWFATKLADPLAWWTWSYDNAYDAVDSTVITTSSDATFKIRVTPSYAEAINDGGAVTKTKDAIEEALNGMGLTSTTSDAEKVKKFNDYLCGNGFKYDPAISSDDGTPCPYNGSAYGAFVNEVDGKHVIVCSGYAAAFQALCNEANIPCLTVYGSWVGSSDAGLHAWNLVTLKSKVYAVDTTFNATGSSKDAYLAIGLFSNDNGASFAQTHQPFTINIPSESEARMCWGGLQSYLGVSEDAYKWPEETGFAVLLAEWGPWIVISLICAILAYVLYSIGKKGGQ